MRSVDAILADMRKLCDELEQCRITEKRADDSFRGLSEISSRAQRCAVKNHALIGCDEHTQEMYLMILFSVASLDDNAYSESLFTIYRIIHGMEYKGDAQALWLRAKQINFETIDECTRLFINSDKKRLLVTECLLIAANFTEGKRKAMKFIADISSLLCLEKNELTLSSNMARAILTLDPDEYKCNICNNSDVYESYIEQIFYQREKKIQVFMLKISSISKFNYGIESVVKYVEVQLYENMITADVIYNTGVGIFLGRNQSNKLKFSCGLEPECKVLYFAEKFSISDEQKQNDTINLAVGFAANSPMLYYEAQKKYEKASKNGQPDLDCRYIYMEKNKQSDPKIEVDSADAPEIKVEVDHEDGVEE
jgi:hypothetical protein